MHINEGKGNLALFSTKDNVLLTLHPSYSSAIDLFSLLNVFIPSSSSSFLLFSLLNLVFPPSPPPPPPPSPSHFYRKNNKNEEEEEEEGIKALRRENNKNEVEAQVNESPAQKSLLTGPFYTTHPLH